MTLVTRRFNTAAHFATVAATSNTRRVGEKANADPNDTGRTAKIMALAVRQNDTGHTAIEHSMLI